MIGWTALLAVCAGCSPGAKDAPPPDPTGGAGGRAPIVASDLPVEAISLLEESLADSCSVCAREKKGEAFSMLQERLPPGAIVRSDGTNRFRLVPGRENELALAAEPTEAPPITLRFHTGEDHLVGIAPSDFTDPAMAERLRAFPPGAPFEGAVEVVPFAYGDGATFSYFPSENRVSVHCRIRAMENLTGSR